jgi:hypothetical protein
MKTIIAGSRDLIGFTGLAEVEKAISDSDFDITEVVCGCAKGVDELGLIWGTNHDIPVKRFPAQWNKFGKSAGPQRNIEMARYANALIAVWDGRSKGTAHMIKVAKMQGLKVHVHVPNSYYACIVILEEE